MIPTELLEMAGISEEARFVGRADYFQIWDPQSHEEHRHQGLSQARTRTVTLPVRPGSAGKV